MIQPWPTTHIGWKPALYRVLRLLTTAPVRRRVPGLMLLLWAASVGCVWASNSRQLTPGETLADFGLSPSQVESLCATRAGVSNLVRTLDYLIEVSDNPATALPASPLNLPKAALLNTTAPDKERDGNAEPQGIVTHKDKIGLKTMGRLARLVLAEWDTPDRATYIGQLRELAGALNNNHRPTAPPEIKVGQAPRIVWKQAHYRVGCGLRPAENLEPSAHPDLSRVDPMPSTFWKRIQSVSTQDLYAGFGRSALPDYINQVWSYDKPKMGPGSNPGFDAMCDGQRIKIKLGETTSEPLTARIFAALGYYVEPTDYVPFLKVNYDRRLLTELNSRQSVRTRVTLLGLKVGSFEQQKYSDPFQFIQAAVMKDGRQLSSADLKQRLFFHPDRPRPERFPDDFRPEVEREIEYLVTSPANVRIKDAGGTRIGRWNFDDLGHAGLRELRGVGLLAAWLNWCDSRFDNTRLVLVHKHGPVQLRHYFTDLGGGLGEGTGFISRRGESPNDFAWSFTKPAKDQGHGGMRVPFKIIGYRPLDETPAFKEMTLDDARWMARLIAQLTETQVEQALIASGFDSAQVRLYTEKLISRRDRMILDLDLQHEIALLRPQGPIRDLNYNPALDGLITARTPGGQSVQASSSKAIVLHGRVVPSPTEPPAQVAQRSFTPKPARSARPMMAGLRGTD